MLQLKIWGPHGPLLGKVGGPMGPHRPQRRAAGRVYPPPRFCAHGVTKGSVVLWVVVLVSLKLVI